MRFDPVLTRQRLQRQIARLIDALGDIDPMAHEASLQQLHDSLAGEAGEVLGKVRSTKERMRAVADALAASRAAGADLPFVRDWYEPNYVVYEQGGELYARSYEFEATGAVKLGKPQTAELQYKLGKVSDGAPEGASAQEVAAGEFEPEIQTVLAAEAAGVGLIKLIRAGQGSSGEWTKEALENDGPKAWPKGTHMYLDHPTESESRERPERSVQSLAGVLTENAKWMEDGPAGPGLYARVQVQERFRKPLSEMAPYIGVSVRAMVTKAGNKIVGILPGLVNSVDFVTKPGAGGQVVQAFESLGRGPVSPEEGQMNEEQLRKIIQESVAPMAEQVKQLQADITAVKAASEAMQARITDNEVREAARALVAQAELPEVSKTRAVESLVAKPTLKADGSLDQEAFAVAAEAAVKRESEYVAALGGAKVTGMGGGSPLPAKEAAQPPADGLIAYYVGKGYSEEAARRMAGVKQEVTQ